MFENYPALLITKLYVPRARAASVPRPHLLAALDKGLDSKLIVIAAGAGSGKTTLAADWSSQRAEPVSWLSLDKGDNDPARFWSYVIAAIQMNHPGIGQELLAALQSPQPPAPQHVVQVLINQLAALPTHLILMLDDYHVIEQVSIHESMQFLLDHLPPQITIMLLTRADPPLPLARLRAHGDVLEVRAGALRFSTEEAEQFFNQTMQLDLPSGAILSLGARTEGWIAGLQLAAIALQTGEADKANFVEHFSGSNRFVLDYLIEEVLSRQPENIRWFLLHTSILRRLNGALCNAVIGATDGQAMLEHLEKQNLFVIPLDQSREWYRYHHLFADLLQARLQAEYPDLMSELYRRAADWHETNGYAEDAIEYALAGGDFEDAARLITGAGVGVSQRGEVTTLLNWYRAFPAAFVASNPRLSLYFGIAFALNGRWREAETLLDYVERQEAEARPHETLMLAYMIASYKQDAARLDAILETATANPQPDAITKLVLGLMVSLRGDLHYACQLIAEAQHLAERMGDTNLAVTCWFHRCRLHVFAGDLRAAYELSHRALEQMRHLDGSGLPMATFAHTSLGRILIEWNEPEAAEQHLREAIRLGELSGFVTGMVSSATMMLAETQEAQGDAEGANRTAQEAIALAERYDPPPEVTWLKTYQARLWLAQRNSAAGAEWLRALPSQGQSISLFYPNSIHIVTRARVFLGQRKIERAIELLTQLIAEPHDLLTVEALGTLALARAAGGDSVHALLAVEQALTLAEAENRVRALMDLGQPMANLLARFCETHPDHEFARRLLEVFPAKSDSGLSIESLSERELEVLRLIAAGHSNEEIAQTLILAVSTVKWYINVLYGKLHVKTRGQAIARAHELRLLNP